VRRYKKEIGKMGHHLGVKTKTTWQMDARSASIFLAACPVGKIKKWEL
jgi:hypothetical protein